MGGYPVCGPYALILAFAGMTVRAVLRLLQEPWGAGASWWR